MQDRLKTVIVAGHICLDVLPDMAHLSPGQFTTQFQPGHLVSVGQAVFATGGPVSNVGLALHRLGIPTRLIAKTGDDPYGRILRQIIAGYDPDLLDGVRTDHDKSTSYTVIISPPGIDRIFLHCSGVNDFFQSTDIDNDLVADADILHFGYPPVMQQMVLNDGAELVKIFREAKNNGITTSLDMAFPDPASPGGQANWRKILGVTLPHVDIFTPSLEEILFMLHREWFDYLCAKYGDVLGGITPALLIDLGDELLEMGASMVLIKLGHHGAYMHTSDRDRLGDFGRAAPSQITSWANQRLWTPCFKVDIVGTTGSGDATIAGFLSGLLRDTIPREALNAAVAVGACNVEAADALSGLCTWEETLARIQRGWDKHDLDIQDPGWVRDSHHAMWFYNL